jgi:DNA helicase INO80
MSSSSAVEQLERLFDVSSLMRQKRSAPDTARTESDDAGVVQRVLAHAIDAVTAAQHTAPPTRHLLRRQRDAVRDSTTPLALGIALPYRVERRGADAAFTLLQLDAARSSWPVATAPSSNDRALPTLDESLSSSSSSSLSAVAQALARAAQSGVRQHVVASVAAEREFATRAKTLARDALAQMQRAERARLDLLRRKQFEERVAAKLREEEEERQRQQRKLNFLLTQTELYTHFVANKAGGGGAVPAAAPGSVEAEAIEAARRAADVRNAEVKAFDDLAAQARAAEDAESGVAAAASASASAPSAKVQFNEVDERIVAETQAPALFAGGLKSYQQKGLAWLANLFDQSINGILADEMGLGKTVQSISLLAHLAERRNVWGPFLVVAPSSTLHNWYQEITKFCPAFTVRPYWGTKQQREVLRRSWKQSALGRRNSPWHVVVTSYQLIVQDEKFFTRLKWQYMVMDEAHFLKNSSSARWKVLLSFKCRNRLLLTGTPIQNNMAELWALLHFIMPTLFDSHQEFADWFSKDIESHATGLNAKLNEHQLHRLHMILKPFMLRRVKRDVENEMARKIEKELYCDLTSHQRRLYRMVRGDFSLAQMADVSRAKLHMGHLMNVLMHLRKVCNHPALFESEPAISPFACTDAVPLAVGDQLPASFAAARGDSVLARLLPACAAPALDCWTQLADVDADDYSPLVVLDADARRAASAPLNAADRRACVFRDSLRLLRFGHNLPLRERVAAPRGAPLLGCMSLWHPSATAQRSSPLFACLRVAGVSPGEAWFSCVAPLLERWLALRRAPPPRRRPYVAPHTLPSDATRSLALERLDAARALVACAAAYCARVVAPPAQVTFVDSSDVHLRELRTRVFADEVRTQRLLHGLPDAARLAALSECHSGALLADALPPGAPVCAQAPLDAPGALARSTTGSKVRQRSFDDMILASGKLTALDRLLTQLRREGHRVLLYSQMTKMLDVLEDFMAHRRYRYVRLDGSSRLEDRRDLVTDWQTNDELFVFLLSTRAGGIGINLTAADTVVFYDGDWNPTMDEQAMDRTHRLGQTKQVTVYRLLASGTIEERIMRRAREKQRIHSLVIKGSDLSSGNMGADAAQITAVYGNDAITDAGPDELDTQEVLSLLLDDDESAALAAAQRAAASNKKRARAQQ